MINNQGNTNRWVACRLCAGLTFLHKARFRGTWQFLAVAAYCFGRTGVPLALVHEACLGGTESIPFRGSAYRRRAFCSVL